MDNIIQHHDISRIYDLKGSVHNRFHSRGKVFKDNDWLKHKEKLNLG